MKSSYLKNVALLFFLWWPDKIRQFSWTKLILKLSFPTTIPKASTKSNSVCPIGIHPHDAKSWDEETYSELKDAARWEPFIFHQNMIKKNLMMSSPPNRLENNMTRCAECVAIGECGLDFNRNFSPPEVQIEVFEKQVALYSSKFTATFVNWKYWTQWRLLCN